MRYVRAAWIMQHAETSKNYQTHMEVRRQYNLSAEELYIKFLGAYIQRQLNFRHTRRGQCGLMKDLW